MSELNRTGLTTINIIKSQIKGLLKQYPARTRTLANVFYYACNILQKDPDYSTYLPLNVMQTMKESFKPIGKYDSKKQALHEKLFHELHTAFLVLTFPGVKQTEIEEIKKYFYELGLKGSLEGFLRDEYKLGYEKNCINELPLSILVSMKTAARSVEHFSLIGDFDIATMQEKLHKYYDGKNLTAEFPTTIYSGPLSFHLKNKDGNKVGYVHVTYTRAATFFIVAD